MADFSLMRATMEFERVCEQRLVLSCPSLPLPLPFSVSRQLNVRMGRGALGCMGPPFFLNPQFLGWRHAAIRQASPLNLFIRRAAGIDNDALPVKRGAVGAL